MLSFSGEEETVSVGFAASALPGANIYCQTTAAHMRERPAPYISVSRGRRISVCLRPAWSIARATHRSSIMKKKQKQKLQALNFV